MGRYWIRNRGKTQGPLSADKIHGLLRRGRFNRHYQVSEDRKNWYVATDFPELFPEAPASRGGRGGRGGGGADGYDDDDYSGGGGSPFEDDYESAPPKRRGGSRRSRDDDAARNSPFNDQDEDDDEDDEYEDEVDDRDDDDDDDDWDDDDDEGAVYRLVGWIEQKWQGIVVLLVAVMIGLGWYVFFRETFVQDQIDLDLLMDVHGRITTRHTGGVDSNGWTRLAEDTELELSEMVERLKDPSQASARDHIKQELLFAARDDLRRIFDELPNGNDTASERALNRFREIEAMIETKTRQKTDDIVPRPVPAPAPPPAENSELDPADGTPNDPDAPSPSGDAQTPPIGLDPAPAL
ncbi:MAG: hypothetical protein GY903_01660 [Fuerstiella sp.]|nr:hypothetical protein [Fuerstiella sp.]MCP4853184.1 hypothetical protein [Fuerstiella sp.]